MQMPEYQETVNEIRDDILQDHFQGLLCASYKSLPLNCKIIFVGKKGKADLNQKREVI